MFLEAKKTSTNSPADGQPITRRSESYFNALIDWNRFVKLDDRPPRFLSIFWNRLFGLSHRASPKRVVKDDQSTNFHQFQKPLVIIQVIFFIRIDKCKIKTPFIIFLLKWNKWRWVRLIELEKSVKKKEMEIKKNPGI